MDVQSKLVVAAALGAVLASGSAWAHSKLVRPAPRSDELLGQDPCGGIERTGDPAIFEPGEEITVEWAVQASHGGSFEIAFSEAGDSNFEVLTEFPDDQGNGNRSANVSLPDIECTDCTLQLVQVNDAGYPLYHSCADLRLVSSGSGCSTTSSDVPTPLLLSGGLLLLVGRVRRFS